MKPLLLLILIISLPLAPITSQAGMKTTTGICDSGMAGVECRKVVTVTDSRDDDDNEWPKARVAYQFRSTKGASCKVQGKLNYAKNMRMIYNTSYLNKSGEWIKPGLVIEQIKKGIWPHSFNWRISCKTVHF